MHLMKTALVTGGSRGIGRAIVTRFAKENWRVAFGYHSSQEAARALADETGAIALPGDLADEQQAERFLAEAIKQLCHVDALIINAGVPHTGLLTDMDTAQWDHLMHTNLRAAFLCARAVLPHMQRQGAGSIVMVSSIWGLRGAACEAAYSASKAGLIGLCQALAREAGPCGIRVNALAPGVIDTDMLSGYTPDELNELRRATPLGHLGTPQDVGAAAYVLCSNEASFITGQVLAVDGGYL